MGEDPEWETIWDEAARHPKAAMMVKVHERAAVSTTSLHQRLSLLSPMLMMRGGCWQYRAPMTTRMALRKMREYLHQLRSKE